MSRTLHQLTLLPANLRLEVAAGSRLQDILFAQGVEFPCGGRGRCKGCRVRVVKGALAVSDEEKDLLSIAELANGWRLACRHSVAEDLELELAQWEMAVLADASRFDFTPRGGLGIAIDLGTTTIAAQVLDLQTGNVLGVRTALNAQARHGADVVSRIEHALRGGAGELCGLVRQQLGAIAAELVAEARSREPLTRVVIVGNTVMHHLFCGLDVRPLAMHPFQPEQPGRFTYAPGDLGWVLPAGVRVEFLPCVGGFVGSDVLAGVVATGICESAELQALIDLGTNGEVVIGDRRHLFCASTAAGPAFEGARISMGMRAITGAISEVHAHNRSITCRVIGGGEPRGLCGSGVVDAVAAGLLLGWIRPDGRMTIKPSMSLAGRVTLCPADVRELQLAKGAIAAGLRLLAMRLGAVPEHIRCLHLAGAFGNYINRSSAQRIGLFRVPLNRVAAPGNTALLGAKRALFEEPERWDAVRSRMENVALNEEPGFMDIYAEEMRFPA